MPINTLLIVYHKLSYISSILLNKGRVDIVIEYKYYNTDVEIEEATQLLNITAEQEAVWNTKYDEAQQMANYYKAVGNKSKAKRIGECGSIVKMVDTETGEVIHYRNRCNVRMCPICTWRKGLKIASELKQVVKNCIDGYKVKWITITLTVKSVVASGLKGAIDNLNKGLGKLLSYAKVKKVVKGTYSSMEITYNKKTETYHPHFHIMLAVLPSYFKKADYRINNSVWEELWMKAMNITYKPQVKVQTVKDTNKTIDELTRFAYYTTKGLYNNMDMSDVKGNVLQDLDEALSYKRMYKYTGIIKEIRTRLRA